MAETTTAAQFQAEKSPLLLYESHSNFAGLVFFVVTSHLEVLGKFGQLLKGSERCKTWANIRGCQLPC